jgi:uncharacterized protein
MAERTAVRQGLFTVGDDPRLLGSRCHRCGHAHFPCATVCPFCGGGDVEETELSASGTLWAWTAVTAAPPGYRGTVPYGFGVVELPEGLRVITRLTEADPSRLHAGQPMHLVLDALHVDDEGNQVVGYAFAPGGAP